MLVLGPAINHARPTPTSAIGIGAFLTAAPRLDAYSPHPLDLASFKTSPTNWPGDLRLDPVERVFDASAVFSNLLLDVCGALILRCVGHDVLSVTILASCWSEAEMRPSLSLSPLRASEPHAIYASTIPTPRSTERRRWVVNPRATRNAASPFTKAANNTRTARSGECFDGNHELPRFLGSFGLCQSLGNSPEIPLQNLLIGI